MKEKMIHAAIRTNFVRFFNRYTKDKAAIFMMHRFCDPSTGFVWDNGAISADLLERCFSYLRDQDYAVLSFKEVISRIIAGQALYKTVCFTVDDGYVDFKNTAFPVCQKYNIPVTVFVTTDFISGNLMMWWDKVEYLLKKTKKEMLEMSFPVSGATVSVPLRSSQEKNVAVQKLTSMLKFVPKEELLVFIEKLALYLNVNLPKAVPSAYSALTWQDAQTLQLHGIDFEPHTVTHPILSQISVSDQQYEIRDSIYAIKDNLNSTPHIFCYPNGTENDFNETTIEILRSEGVLSACTAERGFCMPRDYLQGRTYRIPRIPFPKHFEQFVLLVAGYRAKFNTITTG